MSEKAQQRRRLKCERSKISPQLRNEMSHRAAEILFQTREYQQCSAVLCFLSTPQEFDTDFIISRAFADGKKVASPRCIKGTHQMEFLQWCTADDLETGAYGIIEPKLQCSAVNDLSCALCILPGLAYDLQGHRLGYGGGYYDRFLSNFSGIACGVCYDSFVLTQLPTEPCDIAADMLVTDKNIYYFK